MRRPEPEAGVGLIRQGIAGLLEVGSRLSISRLTAYVAAAQQREGAIVDALETVEQALQVNPDELSYRPETLRLRGELRLKQGQTELAEAGGRIRADVSFIRVREAHGNSVDDRGA